MVQKVSLGEEWSQEATFESCSKQFHLQNLYFKATRFRLNCDCVAQVSGCQDVKSLKIYTNQHLFNFSKEYPLHLVALQMSWQQASSFTSLLCIYQEEPRQSIGATNEQLANAYSKELTSRTAVLSHKLSRY